MSEATISALQRLLKSEKYSDLTLKCQGKTFPVHRAIVCLRSPVLAAAVDGKFKEATTGEIDLVDDEASIITAMVCYLYTGNYRCTDDPSRLGTAIDDNVSPVPQSTPDTLGATDGWELAVGVTYGGFGAYNGSSMIPPAVDAVREAPKLMFHAKIYITAEKYDIPALKTIAKDNFQALAPYCWNSNEFCEATKLLWSNTMEGDRALRDVIVLTAKANAHKLLDRIAFVEFMGENADFCVDMIKALCGRLNSGENEKAIQGKVKKSKKMMNRNW